jgi:hypothetical protein
MICPKCAYKQAKGKGECQRCGVIFAKVRVDGDVRAFQNYVQEREAPVFLSAPDGALAWLKERILTIPPGENSVMVAGRAAFYLVLLIWGGRLMSSSIQSNYVGESFLHLINLPFHEAGHVIFSPFGRLIQFLGGTLGQWLVPFIVLCAFLVKGNPFGAAVGLWWLGESFLDIAPYMDDARAGQLMLLGGVTGSEVEDYHDWEVILSSLGWLKYDHLIARISFTIGSIFMILSFVWGGYILWRQFKELKNSNNTFDSDQGI